MLGNWGCWCEQGLLLLFSTWFPVVRGEAALDPIPRFQSSFSTSFPHFIA